MKVLIVDDSQEKIREVTQILISCGLSEDTDIHAASSVAVAAKCMKEHDYELLILDLFLPMRMSEEPRRDGGSLLLREIERQPEIRRPEHILGLTVDEEAYASSGPEFSRGLWTIVKFDTVKGEWKEAIREKVRYLCARADVRQEGVVPECDALFICALRTPELSQLKAASGAEWKEVSVLNDPTRYFEANFELRGTRSIRLIACSAPSMGMTSAAALTTKACLHFRPKVVAMTGICAGREGEVSLGDCLVASTTWDYGSGKFSSSPSHEEVKFFANPYQLPIDAIVHSAAESVMGDRMLLAGIQDSFFGHKPKSQLGVIIAPMASGAAVQANADFFKSLAERQVRKVAGIDMEAFAVCWAARETLEPRPRYFICKGVSDFANETKSDDIQEYCAYVSAKVSFEILKIIL